MIEESKLPKNRKELAERLEAYGKAVSALGGMNDLDKALYMAAQLILLPLDIDG